MLLQLDLLLQLKSAESLIRLKVMGMVETVRIEEIRGCEGNCITINDTRIAGPKPWGGGYVIKRWDARVDHILQAVGVDVAEVVRCKDCKYAMDMMPIENSGGYLMGECTLRKEDDIVFTAWGDDFCSYGERKNDG